MVSLGSFNTLKLHSEFQFVYRKGKNAHTQTVVLFYFPKNNVRKVGFTATKKIGNAVVRNRAKRRLRALFLKHSHNLKEGIYVFVAKVSLYESTHKQLSNDFKKTLIKLKVFQDD